MKYFIRFLLTIAGLIFAASLALVLLVFLWVWLVRSLWLKLTGRSHTPFTMPINPREGFEQMFRRAPRGAVDPAKPSRRSLDDVTDVEPKR
jgi:hypothetical protein